MLLYYTQPYVMGSHAGINQLWRKSMEREEGNVNDLREDGWRENNRAVAATRESRALATAFEGMSTDELRKALADPSLGADARESIRQLLAAREDSAR